CDGSDSCYNDILGVFHKQLPWNKLKVVFPTLSQFQKTGLKHSFSYVFTPIAAIQCRSCIM
ncbi:MAG: hypothetical protein KAH21_03330, partial [Spirochaetaceae bacterium]|nr:hypothetical protein [Spirochaetaceae bacterium]